MITPSPLSYCTTMVSATCMPAQRLSRSVSASLPPRSSPPKPQLGQPTVKGKSFHAIESENTFLRHYVAQCEAQLRLLQPSTPSLPLSQSQPAPVPEWLASVTSVTETQVPALLASYETHIAAMEAQLLAAHTRVAALEDELEDTLSKFHRHIQSAANDNDNGNGNGNDSDGIEMLQQQLHELTESHQQELESYRAKLLALQSHCQELSLRAANTESLSMQSDRQVSLIKIYETKLSETEARLATILGEKALLADRQSIVERELSLLVKTRDEYQNDSEQQRIAIQSLEAQIKALTTNEQSLRQSQQSVVDQHQQVVGASELLQHQLAMAQSTLAEIQSKHRAQVDELRSSHHSELQSLSLSLTGQIAALRADRQASEAKCLDSENKFQRLEREYKSKIIHYEKSLTENTNHMQQVKKEIQNARFLLVEEKELLSSENDAFHKERNVFLFHKNQLVSESTQQREQIRKMTSIIEERDSALGALRLELAQANDSCSERAAEAQALARRSEELTTRYQSATHDRDRQHQLQHQELELKCQSLTKEKEYLQKENRDFASRSSLLDKQLQELKTKFTQVKNENEKNSNEKFSALAMLESTQMLATELQSRYDALCGSQQRLRSQLAALELHSSSAETERQHALSLYQSMKQAKHHWQKRAELEQTKTRLARTALSERIDNVSASVMGERKHDASAIASPPRGGIGSFSRSAMLSESPSMSIVYPPKRVSC